MTPCFFQECCCVTLSTFTTWKSLKKKPSSIGKKMSTKTTLAREKHYFRYTSLNIFVHILAIQCCAGGGLKFGGQI